MKTLRNFKKYIVGIMGLASLLLMAQAGPARASDFNSFHSDVDKVMNVAVISVTERDNVGGGKILDIVVENKDGERMILHICNSDCPQLYPNGYACTICAACYESCMAQLKDIANPDGTGERVNFKVFNGYVQGHLTGNGCHCFTS